MVPTTRQDFWLRLIVCIISSEPQLTPGIDMALSILLFQLSRANSAMTNVVTLNRAAVAYAYQDIGEYFIGGIADLTSPIVLDIINRDGIMGYHGVPQMPIFAYKAIGDEISVVEDTDALVDKYCNSKANPIFSSATEEKNCTNTWVCSWGQHPISAQHSRRSLTRSRQRQTLGIGLAQQRSGWHIR